MEKRYQIVVWHGEYRTYFHVVDTLVPEGEGPEVVFSFRERKDAETFCAEKNA